MARPLKFQSVEELDKAIELYFAHCDANNEPYIMSGLALALDVTRKTLLNYEDRPEFLPSLEKAKAKCEAYAEKRLFGTAQVAGAIFNLTNNYAQWTNKQDMNLGGQQGNPIVVNKSDADILAHFVNNKKDSE